MKPVYLTQEQTIEVCRGCSLIKDENCPINYEPDLKIHNGDRVVCLKRVQSEEVAPCYKCHTHLKCPSKGVVEPVSGNNFSCRWSEEYDSQMIGGGHDG